MTGMAGFVDETRPWFSLILLSASAFLIVALAAVSVDGQTVCEDVGIVSSLCQPADCEIYCMREMPEGNNDCQSREDYPPTAKCCDYVGCDTDGACRGSTTLDQFDPYGFGGTCVYSDSEDTSAFVCPKGWTHVPVGDKACQQNVGGYQGSFARSMCCCAPTEDTCNGRQPDYQPDYVAGERGNVPLEEGSEIPWYASINITRRGSLDYFVITQAQYRSRGYDIEHNELKGLGVDAWKGFIRYVRVCNDGDYACGWITENGVRFSRAYCDVNDRENVYDRQTAIEISYEPECSIGNSEDEPKRYIPLIKVDRAYKDGSVVPQFLNFTVVPGVYTVLGLYDQQLTDLRADIAKYYTDCRNSPAGCDQNGLWAATEEAYYDYCHYYVLARSCDMPFVVNITGKCKNIKMEGEKVSDFYGTQVETAGFSECEYELVDGGKYHDFPGAYIAVLNKSRPGSNIGLMNYYVNSLNTFGSTHIVNPTDVPAYRDENIESALKWNQKSAGRIMGCRTDSDAFWSDKCGPGNFTCSMGAGLAYVYSLGFRASSLKNPEMSSLCGYFEWEQPPTSVVPGQRADYFQWNDLDDEDLYEVGADSFDPTESSPYYRLGGGLERYDDQAFDFELGIPERKYIVNESIESISSDITAHFVKYDSVEWRGLDYRLALRAYVCEEGTPWSRKYFRMPWGEGEGDDVDWTNAEWPGGTTYEYVDRNDVYNYTDYPKAAKWASPAWYIQRDASNPIIYWPVDPRNWTYDEPAGTENKYGVDKYWFISPKTPTDQYEKPLIEATRPAHSGSGSTSEEPLYYHNPGGYMKPGDQPRINPFNEGGTRSLLSYYRQFNKRMLWANVFKVTPEFHNVDAKETSCLPESDGSNGGLGVGMGDCDSECTSTDPENPCASNACSPGLHCDGTWLAADFCCPADTTWDVTRECCMRCGVYEAKLYDSDYCKHKTTDNKNREGCRCQEGEGGCSKPLLGMTENQCAGGLECKDNPYASPLDLLHPLDSPIDNACCPKESIWDGFTCIPTSITQDVPTYTRTRGGADGSPPYFERGGGPIWFHFAAGGNLPNETEAGGTWDATEYCREELGLSDAECSVWGLLGWWGGASTPLNSFWNQDVCTKAWTYMRDQGGIWDEQKNLGYDRITWEEVQANIIGEVGANSEGALFCVVNSDNNGYWCTDTEGCNCHPNEASRRGPGPWVVVYGRNDNPPPGAEGWVNPYYMCEAALEGDDSSLPESCGETCRKMLIKNEDQGLGQGYKELPVKAWFDYAITENGGGGASGRMEGGENVLPTELPWNFLHAGSSLLEHELNDRTTSFMIKLGYTASHTMRRVPLAQSCFWEGCSVFQWCHYWRYLWVCNGVVMRDVNYGCPSPCGECDLDYYCTQYSQVCDEYDALGNCIRSHQECTGTYLRYPRDLGGGCWEASWQKRCIRCWGAWKQWACDYPVSSDSAIMFEDIVDTSTVNAKPYGSHLLTSRPLGMDEVPPHTQINIEGFVDYKWDEGKTDELNYREYRVDGSLDVSSIGVHDNTDLLGGFELIVPDSVKVSFLAKDYPPIHDLYVLDSTVQRPKIFVNTKMQEMMHIPVCRNPRTDNSYFHYVINPMKKYFYASQGRLKNDARAFFMAIGETYTWDVTLHCTRGFFYRDPFKQNVGIFRNFHEDEMRYWDFVGFYPQKKDLRTTEISLTGKGASESETFTSKKTPEEESQIGSKIGYVEDTRSYLFNFSTVSISSDKFENSVMRVYSDFRHIEIHPFRYEGGGGLGCGNDHLVETIGAVHKDVYMRHPVELSVSGADAGNTVTVTVGGTDMCTGGGASGPVRINFNFPYTEYSGDYLLGQSIAVEKRSRTVTMLANYMGSGNQYQTSVAELEVRTNFKTIFDYIIENAWVVLIAFLALMSYRLYNSKRMDLQEMWDEWKGKK
jgi:hypothetical protein